MTNVKGKLTYTAYIDPDQMVKTFTYDLDLEYISKTNCVKYYKIIKYSNPDFIKGEMYLDLRTKTITIALWFKKIYELPNFSLTNIMKKCGKKWIGSSIYTNQLPGETTVCEFNFV
jgi:hypothetical protein